ncbi:hypothetical protein ACIRPH_19635 [Nocardiopsis sp. NPDC101807]|uniref:hypothetical protein n=1 Tax=Nocardiopsis sp. NPDC101807 TaxID=3364339 RepID=UPI0037F866C6
MTGVGEVSSVYLASAREAGLLGHLAGEPYVSGFYREPVANEPQILVEYASARILGDAQLMDELRSGLVEEHPEAQRILLRVPSGHAPAAEGWFPYLSYVQLGHRTEPGNDDLVRHAETSEEPLVRAWLADALRTACEQQGRLLASGAALDTAQQILDAPDRESLVFVHEGRAVGHLTLRTDSYEEVLGQERVEMVDALTDDAPDPRQAQRRLVKAAARRAQELGRPLVANVVHTASSNDADSHGRRIIGKLRDQGWSVIYEFWSLKLSGPLEGA